MIMGKLAALGLNAFAQPYSIDMHARVAAMTGTKSPRVLLIPLCSNDNEGYIHTFTALYKNHLGCTVDVLPLAGSEPEKVELDALFEKAQLIFIGGGPNFSAINRIKKTGVGERISAAFRRGIPVAGEGTGAVFLFEGGYIDAVIGLGTETPIVITAQGLGLANGLLCLGYEMEERQQGFALAMLGSENTGLALCSGCALLIDGRSYTTPAFAETGGFFRVLGHEGYADVSNQFSEKPMPLKALYKAGDDTLVLEDYEAHRRE